MSTKEIIARSVRSEKYNSNNDWGFGGKAGTFYYFENKDLSFFRGLFCYRHTPSTRVEQYYYKGAHTTKEKFIDMLK